MKLKLDPLWGLAPKKYQISTSTYWGHMTHCIQVIFVLINMVVFFKSNHKIWNLRLKYLSHEFMTCLSLIRIFRGHMIITEVLPRLQNSTTTILRTKTKNSGELRNFTYHSNWSHRRNFGRIGCILGSIKISDLGQNRKNRLRNIDHVDFWSTRII